MINHELTLIPEPIADGWRAKCSCGWQEARTFLDIETRTKESLIAALQKDFEDHRRRI
jgi:hypothetical protein